jgi:DNA-binding XRE family transcriptional regulator
VVQLRHIAQAACRSGKILIAFAQSSSLPITFYSCDAVMPEPKPQEAAPLPKPRKRALPVASKSRVPRSQPEREIFARNLRNFRVEAGLSQRELAEQTGIAQAHISQMENAMHNVCIDTMVTLAQALRKPLYELFKL